MTTYALAEDRQSVQVIGDNNGDGSGSMTGPVDWKWQQNVEFTCYWVANSNIVSYKSILCIVLILFSSDSFFFCLLQEMLSVLQSFRKYFCTKCTLTLRMYPYVQEKKIQVFVINKDVRKSLAHNNRNEILIWI